MEVVLQSLVYSTSWNLSNDYQSNNVFSSSILWNLLNAIYSNSGFAIRRQNMPHQVHQFFRHSKTQCFWKASPEASMS